MNISGSATKSAPASRAFLPRAPGQRGIAGKVADGRVHLRQRHAEAVGHARLLCLRRRLSRNRPKGKVPVAGKSVAGR